ncbi:hypothetical protein HOLDEFILI_00381 [Holdemania filiformis DSM 12042]|uniref:Uncharacterized protein n=1 Tax=Holdemania filiformis DSM 12042 TaxID=545696 RepID=B9Y3K6_9FIRM|nr:hypothetical protein HOLDEFILI_00381 [Holdemania filiformis DSM 12042]
MKSSWSSLSNSESDFSILRLKFPAAYASAAFAAPAFKTYRLYFTIIYAIIFA